MTLRHLKIFRQVCSEGSITKAAAALGMTQPSVSVAISELEDFYKVKLFDRISRRLQLTPAGAKLLGYADTIMMQFNESVNLIRESDVRKTLKIGICTNFASCYGPTIIRHFQMIRPDVSLKVCAGDAADMIDRVSKFEVDLGVTDAEPPENMQSIVLKADKYVLLCEKEFARSLPHPLTTEDMKKIPLILPGTPDDRRQPLREWLEENGISDNVLLYASDTHTMSITAEAGIAALPILSSFAKECVCRYPNCTYAEIKDAPAVQFRIIMPRGKTIDPAMQTFIDILLDAASENLPKQKKGVSENT